MKLFIRLSLAFVAALGGCDCGVPASGDAGLPDGGQDAGQPSCDRENGGCDPHAKCVERGGRAYCICEPWYVGDGLSCAKTGAQEGSPWPMAGGNVRRTGQSPFVGPQTSHERWPPIKMEGYGGRGPPVIDFAGVIYVGADGNFHAFRKDGSTLWSYQMDNWWSSGAIAANGILYVGGAAGALGYLYAFDTSPNVQTRLKWAYETEDAYQSSPSLGSDGTVYLGAMISGFVSGAFFAFPPSGDAPIWTVPGISRLNGFSPAIGLDGTILFAGEDAIAHALTPDGKEKWRTVLVGQVDTSSAIIAPDGTLYIGTFRGGCLYALNSATGEIKWSFQLNTAGGVFPVALDVTGTVYVSIERPENNLVAIDPSTFPSDHTPKWSFHASWGFVGVAIGADGTIYAGADRVYALRPDGTLKWSAADDGAHWFYSPALANDGTIYITDDRGYLYAFDGQ